MFYAGCFCINLLDFGQLVKISNAMDALYWKVYFVLIIVKIFSNSYK
jgi:hypothetical protein